MKTILKTTNLEVDLKTRTYLEEKINSVVRFLGKKKDMDPVFRVELERVAAGHRKSGNVFRAEINLDWKGKVIRVEESKADILSAIDEVKDELILRIKKLKEKGMTKHRRTRA